MTKYRVHFSNGYVEFTDATEAQTFCNVHGGLSVETVQEDDSAAYVAPLMDREVSNWRIRSILLQRPAVANGIAGATMLDQVTTLVTALPEPQKSIALQAWEYGATTNITSNIVKYLAAQLSLSQQDVVDLFDQAQNLII